MTHANLALASVRDRAARDVLTVIASKWTVLIVDQLVGGPKRYNELRRLVGGVSQKVLTSALRDMERGGLVQRTEYPTRPITVDYRLTDLGRCLSSPIGAIRSWVDSHLEDLVAARNVSLAAPDIEPSESGRGRHLSVARRHRSVRRP
jgi:DNA-binding HxlR family transcriptional regulator